MQLLITYKKQRNRKVLHSPKLKYRTPNFPKFFFLSIYLSIRAYYIKKSSSIYVHISKTNKNAYIHASKKQTKTFTYIHASHKQTNKQIYLCPCFYKTNKHTFPYTHGSPKQTSTEQTFTYIHDSPKQRNKQTNFTYVHASTKYFFHTNTSSKQKIITYTKATIK